MSDTPIDRPVQPESSPGSSNAPTGGSTGNGVSEPADPQPGPSEVSRLDGPNHAPDNPSAETAGDHPTSDAAPPAPSAPPVQSLADHGAVLRGRVVRVTSERVFVDFDDNRQGFVPIVEFAGQPIPQEGNEIAVIVEGVEPHGGLLILNKRQADELSFWQSVQPGDTLEGVVTGMNKGGLDIDIGGARAFLPASQVDVRRLRDISTLIGEHLTCIVTQVDPTTRDLVVSRRKYIEQQRKEKRAQVIGTLVEGEKRTGIVSNITDYGAFIDLGGAEGLLHLTEMSWSRVRHPREVVQEGQSLEVSILKVNRQTGKVSLGLKQLKPDPWDGIETRYPAGERCKARVVRMADFGAFLELEEGVDALLPLGEMSWSRRITHPSELLNIGDTPEVVVLKVDPDKRRIAVGLKQTEENPWTTVESRFPPNTRVTGKVSKITDFGAFVELVPGVEGLVHISELSDRHVKAVCDVVQEGQEIEVRVIKADQEAQRISLSMKPESKAPRDAANQGTRSAGKPKKKRTKPLRGGLASHFKWW